MISFLEVRVTIFRQPIVGVIAIQCFILPSWAKISLSWYYHRYHSIFMSFEDLFYRNFENLKSGMTFLHGLRVLTWKTVHLELLEHYLNPASSLQVIELKIKLPATRIKLWWTRVNTILNCQVFLESLLFRWLSSVSLSREESSDRVEPAKIFETILGSFLRCRFWAWLLNKITITAIWLGAFDWTTISFFLFWNIGKFWCWHSPDAGRTCIFNNGLFRGFSNCSNVYFQ